MLSMFYSNFTMLYSSLICPKPLVNLSNLPMTISSNTMTIFNMTVIYTWAFLSVLALWRAPANGSFNSVSRVSACVGVRMASIASSTSASLGSMALLTTFFNPPPTLFDARCLTFLQ